MSEIHVVGRDGSATLVWDCWRSIYYLIVYRALVLSQFRAPVGPGLRGDVGYPCLT